jgi:hypothetical protein
MALEHFLIRWALPKAPSGTGNFFNPSAFAAKASALSRAKTLHFPQKPAQNPDLS